MTKTTDPDTLDALAMGLSAIAARMEPEEVSRFCAEVAAFLTQAMTKTTDSDSLKQYRLGLWRWLSGSAPEKLSSYVTAGIANAATPAAILLTPVFLAELAQKQECRLPTSDLVELLKNPLCVGVSRRAVLDQLENRYHRKFATHWDFVRYAKEQLPDIDLLTPPKRPQLSTVPAME